MDAPLPVDVDRIAKDLKLKPDQVRSVAALLDEGNTVPFITRYRKERTGNLDEVGIRAVQKAITAQRQLAERAQAILRLIDAQGKLTPELKAEIEQTDSLKRLEDLYLPFRPKRTSRAGQARDRGLQPLADAIWNQDPAVTSLEEAATTYIDAEKELPDTAAVLQGASDILAEQVGEDADVRARCRKIAAKTGRLETNATKQGKESGKEFSDYFKFSEAVGSIPPHRVLAINRGEKNNALRVKFTWDEPRAVTEQIIRQRLNDHLHSEFLITCLTDAVARLIGPSLEREIRREMTDAAEAHATGVFARNLRNLLLQPPVPGRKVLAVDPGFRTGCKIAVLDEYGNCLKDDVVYVTGSDEKKAAANEKLAGILNEHDCKLIAIGNGTACREAEEMISELIANQVSDARYIIVNEAGASIYSTSAVAQAEFPEKDATVRGTISIGRRLQDPLSELVKIEPQHIGVGLYQHDLNSKRLKESLDEVVESCVNYVGVELNTASASLLRYVSGFNQLIARRVVEWREQNGRFTKREQLMEVAGIGEATFTQAAGFLKIGGGDEPLDTTWIHPESYPATLKLLERLELSTESLLNEEASTGLREKFEQLDREELAGALDIGKPTLDDIVDALLRPGRDPRETRAEPVFKQGILKLDDLTEDIELTGTILNVVDFGAFVDVGLKDSGLVHISQLADHYIKTPHDVVAVGDVVKVWVLGVDRDRKRVSLSMISPERRAKLAEEKPAKPKRKRSRKRKPKKKATPAVEVAKTEAAEQKPADTPVETPPAETVAVETKPEKVEQPSSESVVETKPDAAAEAASEPIAVESQPDSENQPSESSAVPLETSPVVEPPVKSEDSQ